MLRYTSFALLITCHLAFALPASAHGNITLSTSNVRQVVALFKDIARLANPAGSSGEQTKCGYIFPGDAGKFGCTGSGRAAADVAAACKDGGELACTGAGTGRTCTCAFN